MLYFSRWKAIAVVATAAIICLCAVPNFFSAQTVAQWPAWAQRRVVLGLDLQGGSHILLEVDVNDVRQQKLNQVRDDVRRVLRDAKIGYTGLAIRGDTVEVRIREGGDVETALSKLKELAVPLGGILGGTGQRSLEISGAGGGLIRLTVTEAAMNERIRQVVEQAVPILEKRINELGLVEPTIQREGVDRILVQVPGLGDPQRLLDIIGRTAKLEFRLVDVSMSPQDALAGRAPPDSEVLEETSKTGQKTPILVQKQVMVSGADLTDAQATFDQRTGEPVVSFRFDTAGARRFAQVTQENVGRPFAIVLDREVISAPVIREPILGGQGQISGNFTVESANDLAILLRAGALPAKLTPIEQRVVGPGLGQDSIQKGKLASYAGAVLVVVFMFVTYGLFGLFANIAVAINVAMIFGVLSLLNATLTLPGIAGIVLTVGIAVDSNVLIYERIREEVRHGRSAISAIDAGFSRALATILDSNITTFIAAAVLFVIGTGPVRGFAVTLGIGIATSLFTAFTLTRLIVATWVQWQRPKTVPI
jgi:preprotein translocase subunit SecD